MASDSVGSGGDLLGGAGAVDFGRPRTNCQSRRRRSRIPPGPRGRSCAFLIVAAIFSRLRTMPASASSAATSRGAVAGDAGGSKLVEGCAVALALLEDRVPAQAGLCAFEDQELEERAVVVGERPTLRRGSAP